jgi:7-carboxy-7-deazaguanine synthase
VLNQQAIEKSIDHSEGLLDVHSIFYTIQGEGPFSGFPAVFIRLAGCNLQCPHCDTEYTQGRRLAHPEVVAQYVSSLSLPSGLVVITGGEPFRQNLSKLLKCLNDYRLVVQIESNGTLPPSAFLYSTYPKIDYLHGSYIVCSPKTGRINPKLLNVACCLKYVLDADSMNPEDGLPIRALGHTANPQLARPPGWWDRPIYLQPMDTGDPEHNQRNIQAVAESCMKHGYKLQLQIHKYIGVP